MPNNKTPLVVAAAFLVGVAGTATVMSHRASTSPAAQDTSAPQDADAKTAQTAPPDQDSKPDAKPADAGAGDHDTDKSTDSGGGSVKLSAAAIKNSGIQLAAVRYGALREALIVPGTVEAAPSRTAKITPPVAGKISRLLVNLGDAVKVGQPLVRLNSMDISQAQAAISQAQSQQRQAKAHLQTVMAAEQQARSRRGSTITALHRQIALAKAGVFSQSPYQAAQSEQSQAQSELLQAQSDAQNRSAILQRDEKLFAAGVVSRAELEQAQNDQRQVQIRVDQAKARVGIAKQALDRERKVLGANLLNQQAVQSAQAEDRAAQGDVNRAQTETREARIAVTAASDALAATHVNLNAIAGAGQQVSGAGQVTIYAPIAGVVTSQTATLGEAVERSTVLLTLQNLNTVTVEANLAENDIARVRVGDRVSVTVGAYPGAVFPGAVQNIAENLDGKTRTLAVRCAINNPSARLRPEMFANVSIFAGQPRGAILIPQSAIVADGDSRVVYIADKGSFKRESVSTGRVVDGRVEVLSGLHVGDRIVTEGAFILKSEAGKSDLKDSD